MIAEDDPSILNAMQIILEDAGYDVDTTLNGLTLKDMEFEIPDLFLLDIHMSGIDGEDICRHLKKQKVTKHIPIIMVSANRDTKKIASECGANDFLEKPFQMLDLLEIVARYAISRPQS